MSANATGGGGSYGYYWEVNPELVRPSYWDDNSINCGFYGDGKTLWGRVLDNNCSMPGEKTFTTSQKISSWKTGTENPDGTYSYEEQSTPPKSINDIASAMYSSNVDIDGNRVFTLQDKINHLVGVWVRSGKETVHAYCSITAQ